MTPAAGEFDPRRLLAALEREYVAYVLIGGLARVLRAVRTGCWHEAREVSTDAKRARALARARWDLGEGASHRSGPVGMMIGMVA